MIRTFIVAAAMLIMAILGSFLVIGKAEAPTDFTGNDYLGLSESVKIGYDLGLLHGMLIGSVFVAPTREDRYYRGMEACLTNMTAGQVEAIISKYMTEHPEQWNMSMVLISQSALGATCRPYVAQ